MSTPPLPSAFARFWASQGASLVGGQVSALAVPIIATVTLHATPAQVGALVFAQTLPYLLFALPAGVWVDRADARRVLVGADVARAATLLALPAAALAQLLTLPVLIAVAFVLGALTILFDVAHQSALPRVIPREDLPEGNRRLQLSESVAAVAGPGVTGALLTLMAGPAAVLVAAAGYVTSAVLAAGVPFSTPARGARAGSAWADVREGLAFVARHPVVRSLTLASATVNIFRAGFQALLVLHLARQAGASGALIGVAFALGSVGPVLGAFLASRLTSRLGLAGTMRASVALVAVGGVITAVPAAEAWAVVACVTAGRFVSGFALPIYNGNQVSVRQLVTPDALLGRVNASSRFVMWGVQPVGALLAGACGQWLGVQWTLALFGVASLLALAFLRSVRDPRAGDAPGHTVAGAAA